MQIITALISALALASSATAFSIPNPGKQSDNIARMPYTPPITSPKAGAVWRVGTEKTVTWDTSSLPHNYQAHGELLLGYIENGSENLDLGKFHFGPRPTPHRWRRFVLCSHVGIMLLFIFVAHPLATNFLLTNGEQRITVPNVPTKHSYIIVLYGDSGDRTGEFTIES